MIDSLTTIPGWAVAAVKWLLQEVFKLFHRGLPAVSIVSLRDAEYHEGTQPGGKMASQIIVTCLVTNRRSAHSLRLPRVECRVPWYGTVLEFMPDPEPIRPRGSAERQFLFFCLRSLHKPRRCTVIVYDQFGIRYRRKMLVRHGPPDIQLSWNFMLREHFAAQTRRLRRALRFRARRHSGKVISDRRRIRRQPGESNQRSTPSPLRIGEAPPSDMLQVIGMQFSLNPKK